MSELEQVLSALTNAYWNMDYYQFLDRTGFTDCSYSVEKFKLFQQSIKGLNQFEIRTLLLIIKQ
jgi:hypothetical protein